MKIPSLSLDDLSSAWLSRRVGVSAALPGLNNDLGSLQAEVDMMALKHPVFPLYSAGNEVTGMTLWGGRALVQLAGPVEMRWRAWMIERRAAFDGWRLESRTVLLPNAPGAVVLLTVSNQTAEPRSVSIGLMLSGRARNTGTAGYVWDVPSLPIDMFGMHRPGEDKQKGLEQTVAPVSGMNDARLFTNDDANAFSVQAVTPSPDSWTQGERVPRWEREIAAGGELRITLLCTWATEATAAVELAREWHGREMDAPEAARKWWEARWHAAFTPENGVFSGHLPVLDSPYDWLNRLYYMGVLTLLTCRRQYPKAAYNPSYLTLWPRRGEGSVYLAWDVPYTAGILARLDPAALRKFLLLMLAAPELHYQNTNMLAGQHGGWHCCSHPHAMFTAAAQLAAWTGERSWLDEPLPAGAPGQAATARPARDAYHDYLLIHQRHHLPGSALVDFGNRCGYVECLTHYAHGTAGYTAVQARALQEAPQILAQEFPGEAERLRDAALSLYRSGDGFFDCQFPGNRRYPAPVLHDLGLALVALGNQMPKGMAAEIAEFARSRLLTPTWARSQDPCDLGALDGIRVDFSWAGCFPLNPPQFAMGLLRAGYREPWLVEWLSGVAKTTAQGVFAQGYWAEDIVPPEAGAAPKGHDDINCLMHWATASGAYFAELVLDGICGLRTGFEGEPTLDPGLRKELPGIRLSGIVVRGKQYELVNDALNGIS